MRLRNRADRLRRGRGAESDFDDIQPGGQQRPGQRDGIFNPVNDGNWDNSFFKNLFHGGRKANRADEVNKIFHAARLDISFVDAIECRPMRKETVANTIAVILAAGKGQRMGETGTAKVCADIAGLPAIVRTLHTFKACGVRRFLVVVGEAAQQVLDVVTEAYPDTLFVFQAERLGTGHAGMVAAEALNTIGYQGNIIVTLGDKYLEAAALERLVAGFLDHQADMELLTVPKTPATANSGAQVFTADDGTVLDIIERTDFRRLQLAEDLRTRLQRAETIPGILLLERIAHFIPSPTKQITAVGDLLALARAGNGCDPVALQQILHSPAYNLTVGGRHYSASALADICQTLNPTLYMFRAECFYAGVRMLTNANAQGEYYLTDVVKHFAATHAPDGTGKYRVRSVVADTADWIQGFNTVEELRAVRQYVQAHELQSPAAP